MADDPQVLRGIDWRETFPFTHIFRAFRIAIHPSKLILALAAVLCLYFGGRILDRVWAPSQRAVPREIELYEQSSSNDSFVKAREAARDAAAVEYAGLLKQVADAKLRGQADGEWAKLANDDGARLAAARNGEHQKDVRYWIKTQARAAAADFQNVKNNAPDYEQRRQGLREAFAQAAAQSEVVDSVSGRGLFAVFFHYQRLQVDKVAAAVISNNWLGGLGNVGGGDGVYKSAFKFFTGAPAWAVQYHWFYFLLYGALFLVVWSLFGGAIARIAAVQVADEGKRLSMRQGLSFAASKFLSFLSAPLIPAIIVVGIGLVVAIIAGVAFGVFVLDWAVGALYFLALAAGFVMTLVILGTAGGLNLMYPTIAVEGSDSFDAISRSFSYVYSRPWRMLWYTTVALAYGAICYLFVRLFIWLMIVLAHASVGLLVFWRQADNLDALWPVIQPLSGGWALPTPINWHALNWYTGLTAWLVAIWVYLTVAMLGAFAISFYFSASTIIYYLIRRDADATEMDDVYLEQPEEDFAETVPPVPAEIPANGAATAEPATTAATSESAASADAAASPEAGSSSAQAP